MRRPAGIPVYQEDIYAPGAILDPCPHYARLRALGPIVWLSKQKVYALTRYAECKSTLVDDRTFTSGHGVALNPVVNRFSRGTTLSSDGDVHARRRKLVAHRLTPRALRTMAEAVQQPTPTPSTSPGTPPGSSDSGTARTVARARAWLAWRPRPSCGRWWAGWSGSSPPASRCGSSTTSSIASGGCRSR